ncbi:MAG TPA: hypothetical protein VMF30_02300, partial [Pirellulales bacterium]|nr:hypothetical protein [Pirellulales bacterium]
MRTIFAIFLALAVSFAAGQAAAAPFDTRPLDLQVENAFPRVHWQGWEPIDEQGIRAEFRPILLTHAGDHSGRVFVPTQQGVIYVLPDRRDAAEAKIFLDLRDLVWFDSIHFEEGLLGLAFHPRYARNGQFFV